jgi:methyltransferase
MLVEARRAAANERARLASGGIEASGDVYGIMRVAYPAAFLLMIVEHAWSGAPPRSAAFAGIAIFVTAKALKWWAILSLRAAWTFRVITVPGTPLVTGGPYRLMRHPNSVAVAGELVGFALMAGAATTGPIVTILFGILMLRRIAIEERALGFSVPKP